MKSFLVRCTILLVGLTMVSCESELEKKVEESFIAALRDLSTENQKFLRALRVKPLLETATLLVLLRNLAMRRMEYFLLDSTMSGLVTMKNT